MLPAEVAGYYEDGESNQLAERNKSRMKHGDRAESWETFIPTIIQPRNKTAT